MWIKVFYQIEYVYESDILLKNISGKIIEINKEPAGLAEWSFRKSEDNDRHWTWFQKLVSQRRDAELFLNMFFILRCYPRTFGPSRAPTAIHSFVCPSLKPEVSHYPLNASIYYNRYIYLFQVLSFRPGFFDWTIT